MYRPHLTADWTAALDFVTAALELTDQPESAWLAAWTTVPKPPRDDTHKLSAECVYAGRIVAPAEPSRPRALAMRHGRGGGRAPPSDDGRLACKPSGNFERGLARNSGGPDTLGHRCGWPDARTASPSILSARMARTTPDIRCPTIRRPRATATSRSDCTTRRTVGYLRCRRRWATVNDVPHPPPDRVPPPRGPPPAGRRGRPPRPDPRRPVDIVPTRQPGRYRLTAQGFAGVLHTPNRAGGAAAKDPAGQSLPPARPGRPAGHHFRPRGRRTGDGGPRLPGPPARRPDAARRRRRAAPRVRRADRPATVPPGPARRGRPVPRDARRPRPVSHDPRGVLPGPAAPPAARGRLPRPCSPRRSSPPTPAPGSDSPHPGTPRCRPVRSISAAFDALPSDRLADADRALMELCRLLVGGLRPADATGDAAGPAFPARPGAGVRAVRRARGLRSAPGSLEVQREFVYHGPVPAGQPALDRPAGLRPPPGRPGGVGPGRQVEGPRRSAAGRGRSPGSGLRRRARLPGRAARLSRPA